MLTPSASAFPIVIEIRSTGEEIVCNSPQDIPRGIAFKGQCYTLYTHCPMVASEAEP